MAHKRSKQKRFTSTRKFERQHRDFVRRHMAEREQLEQRFVPAQLEIRPMLRRAG
jgi:hypothetical protein